MLKSAFECHRTSWQPFITVYERTGTFPQADGVLQVFRRKTQFKELVILIKDVMPFAVLCRAHTNWDFRVETYILMTAITVASRHCNVAEVHL